MAANLAIMRNVRVGHDEIVVAKSCASSALHRAPVYGDKLADNIMFANLQSGRFAGICNVLRSQANGSERGEAISSANFRCAFDHDMRRQAAVSAELDITPDDAIRSNLAGWMYFAVGTDDCSGMNGHQT